MPRTYARKTDRRNGSHKPQDVPATFKPGFLSTLDGRTEVAKALRQNFDEIVSDIGGLDGVGHVKRALIERFVWLEAILQTIEHELVHGQINKAEALGRWVQAVNSLSGLAKVLGVEKKLTERPWIAPAKAEAEEAVA
jgi:hypothetical protein